MCYLSVVGGLGALGGGGGHFVLLFCCWGVFLGGPLFLLGGADCKRVCFLQPSPLRFPKVDLRELARNLVITA